MKGSSEKKALQIGLVLRENMALIVVLMLYLFVQLIFVITGGITPTSDGNIYIELAKDVLKRGELYPSLINFKAPYIWNSGVINFVAACIYLFKSVDSVLIVNSIMNTLSAIFLFLFVQKITNRKTAWICIVLYIVYLSNIAHVSSVLTEVPFFFLIISGLYFSTSGKKSYSLLGGVLLAVSNWFRPLLVIFFPSIMYSLYKQKSLKSLLFIGLGLIITIIVIGGEVYSRTGRFIYQANTGWYNLAMTCDDSSTGIFYPEVFDKGGSMYIENRDTMDYTLVTEIYKERCLDYIMNNPWKMIKQIPYRFFRFYLNDTSCMWAFVSDKKHKTEVQIIEEGATTTLWTKFPDYGLYQYVLLFSQIYYYFILALFVLGLIKAYREKYYIMIIPFLIIFLGTFSTIAIISVNRYHYILIPFMMIFAAYYLSGLKLFNNLPGNK